MCTVCLKELTVAWQNSKPVSCKMHALLEMQLVLHCYIAFLYDSIPKLYIYKNSAVYLSDARVTLFCKMQELRNPTIMHAYLTSNYSARMFVKRIF